MHRPMIASPMLGIAVCLLSMVLNSGVQAESLHRRILGSACAVTYGQCGGITCTNGQTTCSDSAYSCCPAEFSCQRQNQWYWQCLPGGPSNTPPAEANPAQTPVSTPTQTPASTPTQTPASTPIQTSVSNPIQTPIGTLTLSGSSPFPPMAYESHVATVPSSQCQVVDDNSQYPNGLQCQGSMSFPACCSGSECNVYQYWHPDWINTAWSSQSPGAGLAGSDGACYKDFLLGCCPPVLIG